MTMMIVVNSIIHFDLEDFIGFFIKLSFYNWNESYMLGVYQSFAERLKNAIP